MGWEPNRVVCWFSCGAASAVATKIALEEFRGNLPVVAAYCASTLSTEHPDHKRFIADCEQWFGQKVEMLYSEKYEDIYDVFRKTGWLVGIGGARCTTELKKAVRHKFEDVKHDIQVFGFDASEAKRVERFRKQNFEVNLYTPLLERGLSKSDCITILEEEDITPPAMYALGYRNSNCLGCVKGGMGYWNKIRKDFPEVFDRMARIEREMGVAINKTYKGGKRTKVFLDELPPDAGRYESEPEVQCGVLCTQALEEIRDDEKDCEV